MRFFVGLHQPSDAQHFDAAFVSVNRLRNRKGAFAVGDWIMDSGAFKTVEARDNYLKDKTTRLQNSEGVLYDPYEHQFYRDPTAEELKIIGDSIGDYHSEGLDVYSEDWKNGEGYKKRVKFIPGGAAMAITKRYLGDGLYADFDGWHVVLTAENGIEATNTVYLEPEVIRAFEQYIKDGRETKWTYATMD